MPAQIAEMSGAGEGTRETDDRVDPHAARLVAQDGGGVRAEGKEAKAQRQAQPPRREQRAAFVKDELEHDADDGRPAVGGQVVGREHLGARREQGRMGEGEEAEDARMSTSPMASCSAQRRSALTGSGRRAGYGNPSGDSSAAGAANPEPCLEMWAIGNGCPRG